MTTAALRGMESDLDFHVIEPEDAPLALHWVGRRAQKLTGSEIRALLTTKGY